MATENVGIFIDSRADLKGFKEAETAAAKLNKSIKTLATTLGAAYGARAVVNFGKSSVKAFAEDQAATVRLTNAVKNLGLAYAAPEITKFITDLEKSSGVVDEQLRPAFQSLLTTTKDLRSSYILLSNALDISKGSGIDLATVSQDLANGYVGITRGLKKYNTGLSQAELKSKSFAQVLAILNKEYAGANAAYLDTYAGKLDVLAVAADNAKESIGKGLVDAFARLSGGSSVQDTVHTIETITGAINALVAGVSYAVSGLVKLYKALDFITSFGGLTGANGKIAQKLNPKAVSDSSSKTQATLSKGQIKASTALIKAQKTTTAELKKQAALKKEGTVFDLQQIELVAALKGKLSEDEKRRVEAQLALLNGNEAEAKRLTDQILMAQDSTGNLARLLSNLPDAKNPFQYLDAYLNGLAVKAAALGGLSTNGERAVTGINPALPTTNASNSLPSNPMVSYNTQTGLSYNPNAPIELKISGDSTLTKAIADSLQVQSLSGIPSSVQRLVSAFG